MCAQVYSHAHTSAAATTTPHTGVLWKKKTTRHAPPHTQNRKLFFLVGPHTRSGWGVVRMLGWNTRNVLAIRTRIQIQQNCTHSLVGFGYGSITRCNAQVCGKIRDERRETHINNGWWTRARTAHNRTTHTELHPIDRIYLFIVQRDRSSAPIQHTHTRPPPPTLLTVYACVCVCEYEPPAAKTEDE